MLNKKILVVLGIILVIMVILYYLFRTSKKEMMGQKILTLYYSPMCGHCRAFKDTWENFKNIAKGLNVETADVNCLENEDACQHITAFPTLILDNNGSQKAFNEERTIENLTQFVSSN